jgi:two-component system, NtrC family, response regulator AtoC
MEHYGETILVADDDPYIGKILTDRLRSLGHRVLLASSGRMALELLDTHDPQTALLDIAMPDLSGIKVLKEIRNRGKDFPVVMITAYGSIDLAVQAMREGAYDFIPKPFNPEHIAVVVQKAIEQHRLRRKVEILSEETAKRFYLLVGGNPKMNQAVDAAKKAAGTRATVLLLGESGTGKELFARAIHEWSERKDRPFVAINCVGLSRELLESELFGHEKGAFTGAYQLKKGKMEVAHSGTVFLDELGDISPEVQAKLLRFIQEREFERVGGTKPVEVDVRIIAATNRDLAAWVQAGHFREDLYHRLNVILITLPSLRERKEDIPELAEYFVKRFSLETKRNFTGITGEALERLVAYDWPGNVRELANVIEQAVVLGQGPNIVVTDLPARIVSHASTRNSNSLRYREALNNFRRELIGRVLGQTGGNQTAAAVILGVHRKYLQRLIKSLGIAG